MQYLKGCLTESAAEVIAKIKFTAEVPGLGINY